MSVKVDHETYFKVKKVDGVIVDSGVVTAAWVRRFLDASTFFDNLVDTPETHEKKSNGTIVVTQATPDGEQQVTTFVPE